MRTLNYAFLLIGMLAFMSCNDNTLSDQKMVDIMLDMRLSYGIVNSQDANKDSLVVVLKNKVFEIHDVTEEEYNKSLDYLKKDIQKGLEIETKVASKLKELKESNFLKKK